MKEIALTRGLVAYVDDEDFAMISRHRWCAVPASNGRGWYAMTSVRSTEKRRQRCVRMHQMIVPGLPRVDHRDGNGLNNCRSNLRPAAHGQNVANSRKRLGTSSRYKGVTRKGNTWAAQIRANRRIKHLGRFASEVEAAAAYNAAARAAFGEYARINDLPNDGAAA